MIVAPRHLAVAALLWAAGCAARQPPQPVAPETRVIVTPQIPAAPMMNSILHSAGWILALPRERQLEEVQRLEEAVRRDDLPSDRLRLALLYTLGDPVLHDSGRVRELLRSRAYDEGSDIAAETLVRLLLEVADSQDAAAATHARMTAALEAEQAAREELTAKLEALQAIEQEMGERPRPAELKEQ